MNATLASSLGKSHITLLIIALVDASVRRLITLKVISHFPISLGSPRISEDAVMGEFARLPSLIFSAGPRQAITLNLGLFRSGRQNDSEISHWPTNAEAPD